ncbi:hypothetical protein GH733_018300 [Mirounga leonina]|nr:hypothetical protein GH733_018300 [Mirounga leonina]
MLMLVKYQQLQLQELLGLSVLWNGLQRTHLASLQCCFGPYSIVSNKCHTVREIGRDDGGKRSKRRSKTVKELLQTLND